MPAASAKDTSRPLKGVTRTLLKWATDSRAKATRRSVSNRGVLWVSSATATTT